MASSLRLNLCRLGLLLAFLPSIMGFGQTAEYLSELAAARQEVIQTDTLAIRKLDLGEVHPGKNRFTALVNDKTSKPHETR